MFAAHDSNHSPFATGYVPVGFGASFPGFDDDDPNGNRDSAGHTVGTGGTLTASPNATYTYDAAGHLTAKTDTSTGKVTTFAYDHRDRLTGITRKTSGGTVDYRTTYVYDALNRRIAEQVDADGAGAGSPVTTWTVFDGQNPYADFDGAGSLAQRYLHGLAVDALLARSDASGVTGWYLTDRLGSVRDIVDTSGTVLYHTGYDSFGNKVSTTGSGGDRFGFTGREHDAALNLYYYRARFYDPATGRFVSKDPIGFDAGDANLYRYVGNGPTNGIDPSGAFVIPPWWIINIGIGAVSGGITTAFSTSDWKLILIGAAAGGIGAGIGDSDSLIRIIGGPFIGSAVGSIGANIYNGDDWIRPDVIVPILIGVAATGFFGKVGTIPSVRDLKYGVEFVKGSISVINGLTAGYVSSARPSSHDDYKGIEERGKNYNKLIEEYAKDTQVNVRGKPIMPNGSRAIVASDKYEYLLDPVFEAGIQGIATLRGWLED